MPRRREAREGLRPTPKTAAASPTAFGRGGRHRYPLGWRSCSHRRGHTVGAPQFGSPRDWRVLTAACSAARQQSEAMLLNLTFEKIDDILCHHIRIAHHPDKNVTRDTFHCALAHLVMESTRKAFDITTSLTTNDDSRRPGVPINANSRLRTLPNPGPQLSTADANKVHE